MQWSVAVERAKCGGQMRSGISQRHGFGIQRLSFIIIDPDGTAGPRSSVTTDESGVDAREQLPGSHDRRVRAVENAIVAPAKRCAATKTALRSVAPLVAIVEPTHSRQCNNPGLVSSAWIRGAPQPSCAIIRTSRRISASTRGRPGWRCCEIFAQYRWNRSRFHRATVSALTTSKRLAHPRRVKNLSRRQILKMIGFR